MNNSVRVLLRWIDQGWAGVPKPPAYSTVARFPGDPQEADAWSVIIEFCDTSSMHEIEARAGFLSPLAPVERLKPGAEFQLIEGFVVTAMVRVT